MSQDRLTRFGRRLRIGFRAFRYVIWILLLVVLLSVLYLNRVGLPDFAKSRILDQLRQRGIELAFRRLRVSFDRGLIAEDVQFSGAGPRRGPAAGARIVQLELDWSALRHGTFRLAGLSLRDAQVRWELTETNREPRLLSLDGLQAGLHFHTNDLWSLDNLEAEFAGSRLRLNGTITNATAWQEWRSGRTQSRTTDTMERVQARLIALADQLERIHFSEAPELRATFEGDLRDWRRWEAHLLLKASGAETPWGSLTKGLLKVRLLPADTNGLRSAEISFAAGLVKLRQPAAEVQAVNSHWTIIETPEATNRVAATLTLRAAEVKTEWAQAGPFELSAHWQQPLTNEIPRSGVAELRASAIATRWGKVHGAVIKGEMQIPRQPSVSAANSSWGPWRFIEPYLLSFNVELDRLTTPKVAVDRARFTANWKAPQLELTNYDVQLYRGGMRGAGTLDVATRKAQTLVETDFDLQQFAPMMTPGGLKWLRQFAWDNPPKASGKAEAILPDWTNQSPDWRGEVLPTLNLDGEFRVGRGAFRGIPVESGASHVTYSNMFWRLPDLLVTRPEGVVRLEHLADDRTREYYFKFESTIDPQAMRLLVPTNHHRGFDLVQFGELPLVNGEVWGLWKHPELVGIAGTIAVSNLTFRSETGLVLHAAVQYTNRVLTATQVRVQQGEGHASAAGLQVDFPADCLFLTNAVASKLDPMAIGRVIGPKTAKAFEPYRFLIPPEMGAAGTIPLHATNDLADLKVHLRGGPFEWWKIKVPQISGDVIWRGDSLTLSNVDTAFYGGQATGDARFGLKSEEGTRTQFQLTVSDANLESLLKDLKPAHERVQGIVSGRLVITDAVSTNWQTWNGRGDMKMVDGLLWDSPLFGKIFSAVLNFAIPGAKLGSSRATEATASFRLTNGVVHTEDMEVQTTLMVLYLRGDMDLDGRLDARVEASLFRDMWVLGKPLSLLLIPVSKALEYRVSGTLQHPKVEQLYGPVRLFFHPIRTLKHVFSPGEQPAKGEDGKTPTSPPNKGPQ